MFKIRLLWKYPTFNHWVAWLKLFSLFSVGRWATVNMEQSAQENKSIIMTITMVRGSLWWKTCWNKIAFESNLQGLSFVMVLEASISYLMCALVMLISSVFFSILWYFFTFVCLFCFDLFFFLIPSKLNDDLMHLNYGKDTLQLNTLLLITWFITLVRYMKRFLSLIG